MLFLCLRLCGAVLVAPRDWGGPARHQVMVLGTDGSITGPLPGPAVLPEGADGVRGRGQYAEKLLNGEGGIRYRGASRGSASNPRCVAPLRACSNPAWAGMHRSRFVPAGGDSMAKGRRTERAGFEPAVP